MLSILHLDSSARTGSPSATRELSAELVAALTTLTPDTAVTYRDLATEPIAHVSQNWIAASFGAPDADPQAIAHSDLLVDELEAADLVVLGVPMYNFGVPAAAKAWIDQIARAGRTFAYTATGPKGLLVGKQLVIVTSSGSNPAMLAPAGLDFVVPYLKAIFGLLGVTDVHVIRTFGSTPEETQAAREAAGIELTALAVQLTSAPAAEPLTV